MLFFGKKFFQNKRFIALLTATLSMTSYKRDTII